MGEPAAKMAAPSAKMTALAPKMAAPRAKMTEVTPKMGAPPAKMTLECHLMMTPAD